MISWGAMLYAGGCIYLWSKEHLQVFGHLGKVVIVRGLRWTCTRILVAIDGEKVVKLEAPPTPEIIDMTADEEETTFYV